MKTKDTLRIIVADSDELSARIYKEHINSLGYSQVTACQNLRDSAKGLTEKPDIIFVDQQLLLHGKDGIQEIRFQFPGAYIVISSASTNIQTVVNAFKQGAFDYIIKGDKDMEMIHIVLREILGKIDREKNSDAMA